MVNNFLRLIFISIGKILLEILLEIIIHNLIKKYKK